MTARAVSSSRHTVVAHLLLGCVTLVWGCTFPLVKAALREVSPLLFNFLRMALAAGILLILNARGLRNLNAAQWRLCVLAGLFLALGYDLQTSGLLYTTPTRSAFLTGLVVVLVPLLARLPGLRPRAAPQPALSAFAGAAVAFVGIVLLTSKPGEGLRLLANMHRGEWLTLSCALAFAIHLLTLAHGAQTIPARALGTLQIAFAAVFMLFLLPVEPHPRLHWTWELALALAITAVFATAAAFTIQSWAQQHLPASHTALILTLEPVFAAITSYLFLGERLGPVALLGAVLILAGIVLAELGPTVLKQAAILPVEP